MQNPPACSSRIIRGNPPIPPEQVQPKPRVTKTPGRKKVPLEINYLAYDVRSSTVKSLKSLVLHDGVAKAARVIKKGTSIGLLISFADWEQTAHFFQWCSRAEHTRKLATVVRLSCGSIKNNQDAFNEALEAMDKFLADQTITQQDLDDDTNSDEEDTPRTPGSYKFYEVVRNGIVCYRCKKTHRIFRPSH